MYAIRSYYEDPEDVLAVDAASRPFLVQEAIDVFRVVAVVDRGRLQDHLLVGVAVPCQVDLGALAGMQFANDFIAVQHHAGFQRP